MKKKILWLMLSWLIVAALVLASCGEPEGQQEEEEEEEEEEEVGEPQYGGTLTFFHYRSQDDPATPDETAGQFPSLPPLQAIQEMPVLGDWETFGLKGTGEYLFLSDGWIPGQYLKGQLLESWDVSLEEIVWHVRPGIYWAADNVDYMENRELTAEDMATDLIRFWKEAPWGNRFDGIIKSVTATDKYTVVIELESYSAEFMHYAGYEDRAIIAPPEMIEAGAGIWANQVGTGPFMFEEYVIGSHMSFVPNPNYWDTTIINGVEYQVPFIDRLVIPIIPDESSQIAALRTGELDFHINPQAPQWEMLATTAPDLSYGHYSVDGVGFTLNVLTPPFKDNLLARQAMFRAIDRKAFARLAEAEGTPEHFFPSLPGTPSYVPLEELPAAIQLLYDYDVEAAKQMLADAGYPNGFKLTLYSGVTPVALDRAALLKDQWAKIGVEIEILPLDTVAYAKFWYEPAIQVAGSAIGMGAVYANTVGALVKFGKTGGWNNGGGWSDPVYDAMVVEVEAQLDPVAQTPLAREAGLYMLEQAVHMPTNMRIIGHYWWPWLKNYFGEHTVADGEPVQLFAKIWIDEDLKAEMGY